MAVTLGVGLGDQILGGEGWFRRVGKAGLVGRWVFHGSILGAGIEVFGPGVLAGADYLQRPNPAHHAREVAQQDIAGLDLAGEVAPAFGETGDGSARLAKFLPGGAGEQIEPVAHEVFVLIW